MLITSLKDTISENIIPKLGIDANGLVLINSSRDNIVFSDSLNNFIFRVSLTKSSKDAGEEVNLLKYLYEKGFPVPSIIYYDDLIVATDQYPLVVFKYIDHRIITPQEVDNGNVELASYKLSELHKLTKLYCKQWRFSQTRNLEESILKLLDNLNSLDSKQKNKQQLINDLKWAINFYKSQDTNATNYIIHNDYRVQNVLFSLSSQLVGVIDFDWAIATTFPQKDLAHAALEWSFPDGASEINLSLYKLFINSYWEKNDSVEFIEINILWQWSKFAAISDAAHYILSFPERNDKEFKSFMYDKYLYLKRNEK